MKIKKRTGKRWMAGLLALLLFAVTLPMYGVEAEAKSLTYGDFEYMLINSVENDTVAITRYTGNGGDVVIPSEIEGKKVTAIDGYENSWTSWREGAFSGCSSLTSITIPDGVTSIGESAFSNCSSLASITIPDGVTEIGFTAFDNCSSLTSITIPDSVLSIDVGAFFHCESLTSVTIGDSVTSIGESAFDYCSSLTSITIPDSVTSIDYRALGYLSDGKVEGFTIYGRTGSAAESYAEENEFTFIATSADTETDLETESSDTMGGNRWVILGVVALLVAAGIVGFVYFKRKKA